MGHLETKIPPPESTRFARDSGLKMIVHRLLHIFIASTKKRKDNRKDKMEKRKAKRHAHTQKKRGGGGGEKNCNSHTGNRTRATAVRAPDPNH